MMIRSVAGKARAAVSRFACSRNVASAQRTASIITKYQPVKQQQQSFGTVQLNAGATPCTSTSLLKTTALPSFQQQRQQTTITLFKCNTYATRVKTPSSKRGRDELRDKQSDITPVVAMKLYDAWKAEGVKLSEDLYMEFLSKCLEDAYDNEAIVEKSYSILQDMKKQGIKPRAFCYTIVIQCFARNKQVERAFQVASEMEEDGVRLIMNTYGALIRACAIVDQKDRAKKVYDAMLKAGQCPPPDEVSFESIYNALKNL